MLNSGEKKFALCATKKNILTLVLSEKKKILNEKQNHNPPCKLNGRSLIHLICYRIDIICTYSNTYYFILYYSAQFPP